MPTGRTPTMVLAGASQTVTLEDIRTAMPFPGLDVRREFQARRTREGLAGAGKTVRVFRKYSGAEESISVTVPYLSDSDYSKIRDMIEADPPVVAVTYLHLTAEDFDLTELTPRPDSWDWINDKSYQVSFTLLRHSGG